MMNIQEEFEKQAKELESLRGFANYIIEDYRYNKELIDDIFLTAKTYGLLTEENKPTPLLTGK